MGDALGLVPMNAIAFGTKRAFHGFLRVTRKPFASMGLTAARFDMMSALWGGPRVGPQRYPTRQSDLRRMLGVSAPVVSRMVRALEALGWVKREREECGDRRQILVTLTTAGEECIRTARQMLLRAVRRIVYEVICFGGHRVWRERFEHMDRLEGYLKALRNDFGDVATLYYPWGHPDD